MFLGSGAAYPSMKRVSYIYEATYPSPWPSRVRFLATALEITRINHSYVFTEKFLPVVAHRGVPRIYVTPSREKPAVEPRLIFAPTAQSFFGIGTM